MSEFLVKQLPYDLSGQAGLVLIGKYLKRINLNALVDPACQRRPKTEPLGVRTKTWTG
jgi:hypothetical protein